MPSNQAPTAVNVEVEEKSIANIEVCTSLYGAHSCSKIVLTLFPQLR